jgi:hypothetical protein
MSETKEEYLDKVSFPVTAELHVVPEVCEWEYKDEGGDHWQTDCSAWWSAGGSPDSLHMSYCPFCGKRIKVTP